MRLFTIRFDLVDEKGPLPPCYAGETREGLGIASQLETAATFATREIAERFAKNHYGPAFAEAATVIEVREDERGALTPLA
jgi:hypothetical protein